MMIPALLALTLSAAAAQAGPFEASRLVLVHAAGVPDHPCCFNGGACCGTPGCCDEAKGCTRADCPVIFDRPASFDELGAVFDRAGEPSPEALGGLWLGYCLRRYPRPDDKGAFKEMQILSIDPQTAKSIRLPLMGSTIGGSSTPARFDPAFRLDRVQEPFTGRHRDMRPEVLAAIRGWGASHGVWRAAEGGLYSEFAYETGPRQRDYLRQDGGMPVIRNDASRSWDRSWSPQSAETSSYCYFPIRLNP